MIQAAPAPAHDLFGMGQDLCRRLAPSPAPCPPQGKRASLRRRRSVGSAPANGIDAVKRTASMPFGSCTRMILLANSPEVEQVGEAVVSGFGLSLLEIAFRSLARTASEGGVPLSWRIRQQYRGCEHHV